MDRQSPRRWRGWLVGMLLVGACGCSRQDNEALGRIGRRLLERADSLSAEFRDQIHLDAGDNNPLEIRVTQRIKWDKTLADLPIDIKVKGKEVELIGIVNDPILKRRVVETVENTTGVEKVIDNVQLFEGPSAPVPVPVPMEAPK